MLPLVIFLGEFKLTYETYTRILFFESYVRTLTYSILAYAYRRAMLRCTCGCRTRPLQRCCCVLLSVTALHCAASRGHVACVDVLLTSSANVNSVDCSGCTPLFYAIALGHAQSVTSLLHHGANPNHVDLKGRTYSTSFIYTVFCLLNSFAY